MNEAGKKSELAVGQVPSPSLVSFIMMIYDCSLCPDLIFQTHVRCGSLGKAFTINKQTLFTWVILQEAMRLKHLEQGIYLSHTSKYHPDDVDIYWPTEKMAGVDKHHHVRKCLRKQEKGRTSEGKVGRTLRNGLFSNLCGQSKLWSRTKLNMSEPWDRTDIWVCLREEVIWVKLFAHRASKYGSW